MLTWRRRNALTQPRLFRPWTAQWTPTRVLFGGVLLSMFHLSRHHESVLILLDHVSQSIHSLWETIQTLFWAVFGLVDLDSFELDGIKIFTRFWGMLMFGCYSVINIVVLLNLLIAMMNHSYQLISVRINLWWKFWKGKWWRGSHSVVVWWNMRFLFVQRESLWENLKKNSKQFKS